VRVVLAALAAHAVPQIFSIQRVLQVQDWLVVKVIGRNDLDADANPVESRFLCLGPCVARLDLLQRSCLLLNACYPNRFVALVVDDDVGRKSGVGYQGERADENWKMHLGDIGLEIRLEVDERFGDSGLIVRKLGRVA